jgi:hypothetical protein
VRRSDRVRRTGLAGSGALPRTCSGSVLSPGSTRCSWTRTRCRLRSASCLCDPQTVARVKAACQLSVPVMLAGAEGRLRRIAALAKVRAEVAPAYEEHLAFNKPRGRRPVLNSGLSPASVGGFSGVHG